MQTAANRRTTLSSLSPRTIIVVITVALAIATVTTTLVLMQRDAASPSSGERVIASADGAGTTQHVVDASNARRVTASEWRRFVDANPTFSPQSARPLTHAEWNRFLAANRMTGNTTPAADHSVAWMRFMGENAPSTLARVSRVMLRGVGFTAH